MGSIRQSLQAQSKHEINQLKQKNSQKSMFSTLKKERSQQFVWGYPTEEPKKTIGLKLSSKNRNLKRRSV
jgi:hypothetical protein